MGSQVLAICECGVNKIINVGGGMRTFREIQHFPFKCNKCNDVVESNILGKPPRCSKCGSIDIVPYNDPSLMVKKGEDIVAQSFDLKLNDGIYKCARCNQDSLKFESTGLLWD